MSESTVRICNRKCWLAKSIVAGTIGGLLWGLVFGMQELPLRGTVVVVVYLAVVYFVLDMTCVGWASLIIGPHRVWARTVSTQCFMVVFVSACVAPLGIMYCVLLLKAAWALAFAVTSIILFGGWCIYAWSPIGRQSIECDGVDTLMIQERGRSGRVTLVAGDGSSHRLGRFDRSSTLPTLLAQLRLACGQELTILSEE